MIGVLPWGMLNADCEIAGRTRALRSDEILAERSQRQQDAVQCAGAEPPVSRRSGPLPVRPLGADQPADARRGTVGRAAANPSAMMVACRARRRSSRPR